MKWNVKRSSGVLPTVALLSMLTKWVSRKRMKKFLTTYTNYQHVTLTDVHHKLTFSWWAQTTGHWLEALLTITLNCQILLTPDIFCSLGAHRQTCKSIWICSTGLFGKSPIGAEFWITWHEAGFALRQTEENRGHCNGRMDVSILNNTQLCIFFTNAVNNCV